MGSFFLWVIGVFLGVSLTAGLIAFGWWLRGATEWQKVNGTSVFPPVIDVKRGKPETHEEDTPLDEG